MVPFLYSHHVEASLALVFVGVVLPLSASPNTDRKEPNRHIVAVSSESSLPLVGSVQDSCCMASDRRTSSQYILDAGFQVDGLSAESCRKNPPYL